METTVIPFRGLRYNTTEVEGIANVIAPPYDVIKPEERVALEAHHPANIIRLILSQPDPNDTDDANQYTRAARLMNQWITDGTLVRDATPRYYIYDQSFSAPDEKSYTRRALIGLVKLEPFENRVVLPHEKTHAGPKADRLNLMRECHANLSPIFLLYADTDGDIERIMESFTDEHPPEVDCEERFGSTHRLWSLNDAERNTEIQTLFSERPLLIADGHHRYETALAFQEEMAHTGLQGYGYMMVNLVRMESPGLAVLAIHRLLDNLSPDSITHAITKLPEVFEVHEVDTQATLMAQLEALKGKSPAVGMYTADHNYRLLIPRSTIPGQLDVTLVQETLIKEIFRVETLADHISYTAYADDAVAHVKGKSDRVALLMNPTPVEQVLEVAMAGSTMPQKSTYFYPKMATGLVLNLLNW
ncbi:DUF1015 domain-containing protein [Candidatus Poribacteria bacterium]|nr:DUF1015 domain-containing protein [Candidatus Poribacteria bacterium]MYH84170.1 DUF1015 domain-containing protein [Candidatus Poribacteria bacterium]MYK97168.1 DUF1015 domain-containing protein [Candidatus Poribacteria bacterium]